MKCMVFLPDSWAAAEREKAACGAVSRSVDTAFTTPLLFLKEAWGMLGNELALASSAQRKAALYRVVKEREDSFPFAGGAASRLFGFIDYALGSARLDAYLERALVGRAPRAELAECIVAYEQALASRGLIDPGRAFRELSFVDVFLDDVQVAYEGQGPTLAQEEFLRSQRNVESCGPFSLEQFEACVGGCEEIGLILPSGQYAEPRLLLEALSPRLSLGDAAVLTKRPLELFERIAPSLVAGGVRCSVRGSKPLCETHVGQAFMSVFDIAHAPRLKRAAVSDFLLNPLSLVSLEDAHAFDAFVRADRIIEKDEVVRSLRLLSESFACFEELACSPEADVMAGYLEDLIVSTANESNIPHEEHMAALGVLRSMLSAAWQAGLDAADCKELLSQAVVEVSYEMGEGACEVAILGWSDVAALAPASYATVVACDMASTDWSAREQCDALFEECLGSLARDDRGLRPEEALARACAASSGVLCIEWLHHNEDADPLHPTAAVEMLMEQRDPDWILSDCALSQGAAALRSSEGGLHENLSAAFGPSVSEVSSSALADGASHGAGAFAWSGLRLTPAQAESYATCPRRWLADYRLRLDGLDEQFSTREEARFCREALALFYEQFQEEVGPKVTADALPFAQDLMRETVLGCKEAHRECEPSDGRLVAATEEEEMRFAIMAENLAAFLEREPRMLPSFSPQYLDYAIPSGSASRYAGFDMAARIDRIDVDEHGRAIVIAYTASLTPEHNLYLLDSQGDAALCRGKVQALIQAQLVRRSLGLEVVGALYVSYGRGGGVAGAVASCVDARDLPGVRTATCTLREETAASFADLLDETEAWLEGILAGIREGNVAPAPVSPVACQHCSVMSCAKRRG